MHIDRPQHSVTPSRTPTTASRSPEILTPGLEEPVFGSYTEPVSEGEEDEQMDLVIAHGATEARHVRLNTEQVSEAVKFREEVLRRQRDAENDAKGNLDEERDEEDPRSPTGRIPYPRRSSVPAAGSERPRNFSIDPLAPASQFDKSLWSKLAGPKSADGRSGASRSDSASASTRGNLKKPNGDGNGTSGSLNGGQLTGTQTLKQVRHVTIAEEEGEAAGLADAEDETDELDSNKKVFVNNVRSTVGKKISVPVRIEPKVIFANERTFMVSSHILSRVLAKLLKLIRQHYVSCVQKWLHFSVLVGTVATTLLNFTHPEDGIGLIAATAFTFASLISIAYSGGIFVYRAYSMRKRSADGWYYDKYGPTVLCVVLGASIIVNLVLRLNEGITGQNILLFRIQS